MTSTKTALKVTTPSDREIEVTRQFNAPRRLVFDAHTKPELVRRWLLGPDGWTMPVCEIDLKIGGKFRYVWRNSEGFEMGMGGTFREITAPERIVHNEKFDEDWTNGETKVTTTFVEASGKTTMKLVIEYASAASRDGALKSNMTEGMSAGYDRLDTLLAP